MKIEGISAVVHAKQGALAVAVMTTKAKKNSVTKKNNVRTYRKWNLIPVLHERYN